MAAEERGPGCTPAGDGEEEGRGASKGGDGQRRGTWGMPWPEERGVADGEGEVMAG